MALHTDRSPGPPTACRRPPLPDAVDDPVDADLWDWHRFFSPPFTVPRQRLPTSTPEPSSLSPCGAWPATRHGAGTTPRNGVVPASAASPSWPSRSLFDCSSLSHGRPDFSTRRIPVSTFRSATRGRPPLGLGGSGRHKGAMSSQSSSGTKGVAIYPIIHENEGLLEPLSTRKLSSSSHSWKASLAPSSPPARLHDPGTPPHTRPD
ncbi:hypothetical protein NKDENANG_03869 [Candidatus Entotheonellaceae bacterium PAL068K]